MGKFRDVAKGLKQFKDRYTHELPTGPHTDVKKHRLNPSLLDKSIESGRTKERKRKRKVMGMGVKNVLKRMVGQKEGGSVSEKSTHSKTGLREAGYKPQPHGTHSPGNIKTLLKAWGRTEKKKPHSTKEGRHATATRKFGRVLRSFREAAGMKKGGRTNLLEELGRVEAEPSNRNRRAEVSRIHGELNRGYKKGGKALRPIPEYLRDKVRKSGWKLTTKPKTKSTLTGTDTTRGGGPDEGNVGYNKEMMSGYRNYLKQIRKKKPLPTGTYRTKKAAGGVIKAGKRFLDFIKTGKHVDKHGVKVNVAKAAERLTGKPHVDHGKRKRTKHLGKGKAAGGRIGLKHGTSPQQHYLQHGYGPTKARLRTGKPKIAKKGWA